MCPLFLLYLLIAWHVGGRLYRGLYYVDLLRPRSMVLQDVYAFPDTNCFSYRQLLLLWLLNPAIVCHYAVIVSFVTAFVYSSVLIFYVVLCYSMLFYAIALPCICCCPFMSMFGKFRSCPFAGLWLDGHFTILDAMCEILLIGSVLCRTLFHRIFYAVFSSHFGRPYYVNHFSCGLSLCFLCGLVFVNGIPLCSIGWVTRRVATLG